MKLLPPYLYAHDNVIHATKGLCFVVPTGMGMGLGWRAGPTIILELYPMFWGKLIKVEVFDIMNVESPLSLGVKILYVLHRHAFQFIMLMSAPRVGLYVHNYIDTNGLAL